MAKVVCEYATDDPTRRKFRIDADDLTEGPLDVLAACPVALGSRYDSLVCYEMVAEQTALPEQWEVACRYRAKTLPPLERPVTSEMVVKAFTRRQSPCEHKSTRKFYVTEMGDEQKRYKLECEDCGAWLDVPPPENADTPAIVPERKDG